MGSRQWHQFVEALEVMGLRIEPTSRPDRWRIIRRGGADGELRSAELRMSRRRFTRFVGQRDADPALLAVLVDEELTTTDSDVTWIAVSRSLPFFWLLGVTSDRKTSLPIDR